MMAAKRNKKPCGRRVKCGCYSCTEHRRDNRRRRKVEFTWAEREMREADRDDEAELSRLDRMREGWWGRDATAREYIARKVGEIWARQTLRAIKRTLDCHEERAVSAVWRAVATAGLRERDDRTYAV